MCKARCTSTTLLLSHRNGLACDCQPARCIGSSTLAEIQNNPGRLAELPPTSERCVYLLGKRGFEVQGERVKGRV
eukprot:819683-Pyramimonas_sp.AAC.1